MTDPLKRVLVSHAKNTFKSQNFLNANWQLYGYKFEPDFEQACRESDQFIELLERSGAQVDVLPAEYCAGMDSLYVHDPIVTLPSGFGLCRMGKELRAGEPLAIGKWLQANQLEIKGAISDPGKLEGGDIVWLKPTLAAVGIGYRSNESGIQQLGAMCNSNSLEIIPVFLPHWNGPSDVLHLMSLISPLASDVLLVYSRIMPVVTRQRLLDEGFTLIEVPEQEYNTMGCNVLSLGNGKCLIEKQNTLTAATLEKNGFVAITYDGSNISHPGEGGPTCLTRPILRG
ncbi:MAG: arginine deiminase family protein [Bacteroidetes bacterium]|nr:arginine deiminase family protein [Bacteroidota bacterium]